MHEGIFEYQCMCILVCTKHDDHEEVFSNIGVRVKSKLHCYI